MSQKPERPGNVAIVIPAYNEEPTIGAVLVTAASYGHPIVVSDGSTDMTSTIVLDHSATLVEHSENLGYDQALLSGIQKAISLQFKYVVTLDADGQHDPAIVGEIVDQLEKGADVVLGVRSSVQRISEHIFKFFGSWLWSIDDPLCGMKGYRIDFLENKIEILKSYNSTGTEIAIRASLKKANLRQVPVQISEREDDSRFGSGLSTEFKIIRCLVLGIIMTIKTRYRDSRI